MSFGLKTIQIRIPHWNDDNFEKTKKLNFRYTKKPLLFKWEVWQAKLNHKTFFLNYAKIFSAHAINNLLRMNLDEDLDVYHTKSLNEIICTHICLNSIHNFGDAILWLAARAKSMRNTTPSLLRFHSWRIIIIYGLNNIFVHNILFGNFFS